MLSARWLSPVWRFAFIGTVALLAQGIANAQVASTTSMQSPSVSSSESSSTEWAFSKSDGTDALPGAPEPAAAGAAGQYDNKSGGGSDGGWKSKLAFEGGAGYDISTGDSSNFINNGFDVTIGGGWRFSRAFSTLIEYQYVDDGLPAAVVAEAGSQSGNVHLWSLSLEPVYDILPKKSNGVYVTGGAGFYRKVTNFQNPEAQQYCSYFYCGVGYTNQTVGHFSSNQAGFNVGGGFRHKFAGMYGDGKMQIFAEVRYVDVFTPAIVGQSPNGLGNTTIGADTRLLPINFGIRF